MWTVPIAIIGARLFHVLTHPGDYFYEGADLVDAEQAATAAGMARGGGPGGTGGAAEGVTRSVIGESSQVSVTEGAPVLVHFCAG